MADSARNAFDQVTSDLTNLYQTMLKRSPDAGGLQYWVDQVNSGKASLEDVSNAFKGTTEFLGTQLRALGSQWDAEVANQEQPGIQTDIKTGSVNFGGRNWTAFRSPGGGVQISTLNADQSGIGSGQYRADFLDPDTGKVTTRVLDRNKTTETLGKVLLGTMAALVAAPQLAGSLFGTEAAAGLGADLAAGGLSAESLATLNAIGPGAVSEIIAGTGAELAGLTGVTAGATSGGLLSGASDLAVAGVEGAASQAATSAYTQTLAATGNSALAAIAADVASGNVVAGLPVVDAVAAGVTTAADAAATGAVTNTGNVVGGGGTVTTGTTGSGLLSNTGTLNLTGLDTLSTVDTTPTGSIDTTPSGSVDTTPSGSVDTTPSGSVPGGQSTVPGGSVIPSNAGDVITAADYTKLFGNLGNTLLSGFKGIAGSLLSGLTSGNQANTIGQLINAGVGYAQAKQAADALLASGQLSQQQYNQLASNLQTGYQGIQGQYNQLGQNVRDTYTTLGDTYANQMDLLGGRYAGLGQGIAANLGGLGSNLQGQYNQLGQQFSGMAGDVRQTYNLLGTGLGQDLRNIGQQFSGMAGDVRTTYNQFADEAARNVGKFTPYGVTSNLFGQPGTDLQNAALRASQQSFEQAGLTNVDQLSQDYYNKLSALSSPEQQRQRLATEERLRAQGRLGVSGSAYGGTSPELLAQEQAIAQQQLQRELQSRQAALGERGTLLSQGTAALQPAVQLGQFGSQAAQQQFANDLARQQYLTGLQTQGLQNEIALRTQAGDLARQAALQQANVLGQGIQNEIALRTQAGQLAQQGIGTYGNLQQQGLLNQLALEQAGLGVSQQGLTNRANILGQGISTQANLAGRGIGAAEQGLAGSTALQRQGLQDLLARQLQATAARSGANQQLAQGLLGGTSGSNVLGGVVGSALGNLFNPNAAGNVNSLGFGTGLGYGNQDIGLFI